MGARSAARLLVAIPAYNEASSVSQVVSEVRESIDLGDAIAVIDDGSTDGTASAACAAGARVLSLPFNVGVGGAMRTAYMYAAREGYDCVVQVDADGQHDAHYLPELVDALRLCDVVVGARFSGAGDYAVGRSRRIAMRVLSWAVSRIVGVRLADVTSGFRAAGPRAIEVFARHYPSEYLGDTVESLVVAHRAGLTIGQRPVRMRPRQHGQPSQGPLRSSLYLLRALLVLALATVRRYPEAKHTVDREVR